MNPTTKTVRSLKKDTLPDKPSELIRIALADLEKVERDPNYAVCMARWHDPALYQSPKRLVCEVCLAGSVMAKTLRLAPSLSFAEISDPPASLLHKIEALNQFRRGEVHYALLTLNLKRPRSVGALCSVPDYEDNRSGFFAALNRIADRLAAAGL